MVRRALLLITTWILLAGTALAQHVGDIVLTRPAANGPIVTSGGGWLGPFAGRVFDEGLMPASAPYTTDAPGFGSATGAFPAGATIRYDFVKQLLYWNGTAMATPTATMTLDYRGNRPATITGTDFAGAPGAVITSVGSNGSFHEHLNYTLTSNAAAGLYGVVLTLGPGAGSTGFTTSEPFLVTFERGTVDNYATGLSTMVDTAFAPVPEPAGLALGAAAAAGGWLALKRVRNARGRRP
ncbi:MAG: hypothetical protein ACKO1M_07815 [Planctomycetota bacterium]